MIVLNTARYWVEEGSGWCVIQAMRVRGAPFLRCSTLSTVRVEIIRLQPVFVILDPLEQSIDLLGNKFYERTDGRKRERESTRESDEGSRESGKWDTGKYEAMGLGRDWRKVAEEREKKLQNNARLRQPNLPPWTPQQ